MYDGNLIFQQDDAPSHRTIWVKIGLKFMGSRTVLKFQFSNLQRILEFGIWQFFQNEPFGDKISNFFSHFLQI